MEYILVAGVALFVGLNLGVLLVRRFGSSDPGKWPGRNLGHACTVSAWWR